MLNRSWNNAVCKLWFQLDFLKSHLGHLQLGKKFSLGRTVILMQQTFAFYIDWSLITQFWFQVFDLNCLSSDISVCPFHQKLLWAQTLFNFLTIYFLPPLKSQRSVKGEAIKSNECSHFISHREEMRSPFHWCFRWSISGEMFPSLFILRFPDVLSAHPLKKTFGGMAHYRLCRISSLSTDKNNQVGKWMHRRGIATKWITIILKIHLWEFQSFHGYWNFGVESRRLLWGSKAGVWPRGHGWWPQERVQFAREPQPITADWLTRIKPNAG